MSFPVQLKAAPKPQDYVETADPHEKVTIVSSSVTTTIDEPANPWAGQVKLKKAAVRPADYEGPVEGNAEKPSAEKPDSPIAEPVLPVALKKVGLPEERDDKEKHEKHDTEPVIVTPSLKKVALADSTTATADEKTLKLQQAAAQKEIEMEKKRKERAEAEAAAKKAKDEELKRREEDMKDVVSPDTPVAENVFAVKLKKVGLPSE